MFMMTRHVIPAALRCFFHVYEERLGTYGFRVLNHVLVRPTSCDLDVGPHEYVAVGNDIVIDRTWCKTCVAAVDTEARRGHAPDRLAFTNEEIT